MEISSKYSPSEISLHSSKKDCWLVIHGKVYDVTTFLDDHPGGDEVLLHASATGDATKSFEEVGHSTTATSMMEGYLIGALDGYNIANSKAPRGAPRPGLKTKEGIRTSEMKETKPAFSSIFLDILIPLFFLALAFAAWYYLTYMA